MYYLLFSVVYRKTTIQKGYGSLWVNIFFRNMQRFFEVFLPFLHFLWFWFYFWWAYFLLGNWKHWLYSNLLLVRSTIWKLIPKHWTRTTNTCNIQAKMLTEALNFLSKMPIQCFRMRCSCVYHNNLSIFPTEESKSGQTELHRWMWAML